MARKAVVFCLAALAAQVALGATHTVVVSDPRIYATELFGDGAGGLAVDYRDDPPTVTLQVQLASAEADAINDGHRAEVTFALTNAQFANNVRTSRLGYSAVVQGGAPTDVDVEGKTDGDSGDSTVTFHVEADADLPTASSTLSFAFELPELTGLNPDKPVTVKATMGASGGTGWPNSDEDGVSGNVPVITYASGLAFSIGGSGGRTDIPLTNGRMSFDDPNRATLGTVTVGLSEADECTTNDPIPADCILQADGDIFRLGRGDDGIGDLRIAAVGDFREGDMVWLDVDGDRTADSSEALRMDDNGTMTGAFDLANITGNASAAAGEAGEVDREEGIATHTLYYVPNGDDPLRPSEYRTSFSVDFHVNGNRDKPAQTALHNTQYALAPAGQAAAPLEAARSAPAIPSPEVGARDIGNVRIKCESATPCTVYLECDDASGESWFAELDEPIDGRATLRLTSEDIAEALGFDAGESWSDQLSCAILSSRDISVQVLTRTGNVLVNHTYWADD